MFLLIKQCNSLLVPIFGHIKHIRHIIGHSVLLLSDIQIWRLNFKFGVMNFLCSYFYLTIFFRYGIKIILWTFCTLWQAIYAFVIFVCYFSSNSIFELFCDFQKKALDQNGPYISTFLTNLRNVCLSIVSELCMSVVVCCRRSL